MMTPALSIKLCAIAGYRLFHSHTQITISYQLHKVNRSIDGVYHEVGFRFYPILIMLLPDVDIYALCY